jgi:CBS domain containing-hemolysin-like protein
LRELFLDQIERSTRPAEDSESVEEEQPEEEEKEFLLLSDEYESTTIGGLVSEMAGRIPAAGEVVEKDGLRMQVLASTDRRVDRLRVSLAPHAGAIAGESSSQS